MALVLCAAPSLAFAKTVTFPNLPTTTKMKAGQVFKMKMPAAQLGKLQPGGAAYEGVPLYSVQLQYSVDGGPVQNVTVAQPHSTGQGGYDGTVGQPSVQFQVPAGAKSVSYWLLGSNKYNPASPDSAASLKQYWSNYGQNFHIQVAQ